jgi:GT2 family glycosyltransferase
VTADPGTANPRVGGERVRFGVVAIGRNEGDRLRRCLLSVLPFAQAVVYVDSGSHDGSPDTARSLGARVTLLDPDVPFTAARARNQGWRQLLVDDADLEYIQFVDGDCEVVPGWLAEAQSFLDSHPDVAAVAGRRRERFRDASPYNLLCDLEWASGGTGPTKACGGDAMMRARALVQAGGFRDSLIAGEEPELCIRMRAAGWKIWRLDAEMTLHDAAMTRFGQWWKRSVRTGFAYAAGVHLHGAAPERHWVRESRSAWLWGLGLPVVLLLASVVATPWALTGFLAYPFQVLRLCLAAPGSLHERLTRSTFLTLGKFAEAAGQLKFLGQTASGSAGRLIEYK